MVLNVNDECIFPIHNCICIGTITKINTFYSSYTVNVTKIIFEINSDHGLRPCYKDISAYNIAVPCIYSFSSKYYHEKNYEQLMILSLLLSFLKYYMVYEQIREGIDFSLSLLSQFHDYKLCYRVDYNNNSMVQYNEKIQKIYSDIRNSFNRDYLSNEKFYKGGLKNGIPF